MRWYFAIDEAGGLGETGALARLMVLSARAIGGLEPMLLYHGAPTEFTAWMQRQGVRVIPIRPRFLDMFTQAQAAGTFAPYSIGHGCGWKFLISSASMNLYSTLTAT